MIRVNIAELDLYPDGGIVPYRPGIKLMTTIDTNKVYAVEPNGILRKLPSAAVAKELYGDFWGDLVKDIDPGYFSSYIKDSDLQDLLPTGTLAKEPGDNTIYYIEQGKKRPFLHWAAFVDNYFRTRDVITADLSNYINDTSITEFEGELLPYALAN